MDTDYFVRKIEEAVFHLPQENAIHASQLFETIYAFSDLKVHEKVESCDSIGEITQMREIARYDKEQFLEEYQRQKDNLEKFLGDETEKIGKLMAEVYEKGILIKEGFLAILYDKFDGNIHTGPEEVSKEVAEYVKQHSLDKEIENGMNIFYKEIQEISKRRQEKK